MHSWAVVTVLTAMVGAIIYQRMPKDIYPDLNAPLVNIITTCPGMASEDVEQSELILSALRHVEISMLQGGALVLVVILLFLTSVRASLIAALTIPFSILFALILMHLGGVTLTVMALGGLAIGVGKMAGGSVIMVENIYKFYQTDESVRGLEKP